MFVVLVALVFGFADSPAPSNAAVPMLRKNIKSLNSTELQGLRDAVAAMKALPASDPCSWTFQANIHNTQCNHSVPYWLPWHRMYLYYFERILVSKSGGKLKGLPYWGYDNSAETTFPTSFYPTTYGASIPNPLYHTPRTNVTSPAFSLNFASTDPGPANSNLSFSGFSGSLQGAPHNYVHVAINGTMVTFQSPLDPIFWTHHCVIDRLWEKWLALGGGRANPTFDTAWMNQTFSFHDIDAGCKLVSKRVQDVLNPLAQLNYQYVEPIIFIPPQKWWRWFELLPPIKFRIPKDLPFGYVPIPLPVEIDPQDLKNLLTALSRTRNPINTVLRFHVLSGRSLPAPIDVFGVNLLGLRTKLATLAVFGIRSQLSGAHVGEHSNTYELTLAPGASRRFLDFIRNGKANLAFVPDMKGIRIQPNLQPLIMRLESVSVMENAPVDKTGKRLAQ